MSTAKADKRSGLALVEQLRQHIAAGHKAAPAVCYPTTTEVLAVAGKGPHSATFGATDRFETTADY